VNNVFNIPDKLKQSPPFWEQEISLYDSYMDVGVRSHYVAAKFAVPLMQKNTGSKNGLIVNISSAGAKYYLFNVAYGTCKSALERLSKDMARELVKQNICCLTLWPGMVKTERMLKRKEVFRKKFNINVEEGETPEFTGRAVCALISDNHIMKKTGRQFECSQLAYEYLFTDINGSRHFSINSLYGKIKLAQQYLTNFIQNGLKSEKKTNDETTR